MVRLGVADRIGDGTFAEIESAPDCQNESRDTYGKYTAEFNQSNLQLIIYHLLAWIAEKLGTMSADPQFRLELHGFRSDGLYMGTVRRGVRAMHIEELHEDVVMRGSVPVCEGNLAMPGLVELSLSVGKIAPDLPRIQEQSRGASEPHRNKNRGSSVCPSLRAAYVCLQPSGHEHVPALSQMLSNSDVQELGIRVVSESGQDSRDHIARSCRAVESLIKSLRGRARRHIRAVCVKLGERLFGRTEAGAIMDSIAALIDGSAMSEVEVDAAPVTGKHVLAPGAAARGAGLPAVVRILRLHALAIDPKGDTYTGIMHALTRQGRPVHELALCVPIEAGIRQLQTMRLKPLLRLLRSNALPMRLDIKRAHFLKPKPSAGSGSASTGPAAGGTTDAPGQGSQSASKSRGPGSKPRGPLGADPIVMLLKQLRAGRRTISAALPAPQDRAPGGIAPAATSSIGGDSDAERSELTSATETFAGNTVLQSLEMWGSSTVASRHAAGCRALSCLSLRQTSRSDVSIDSSVARCLQILAPTLRQFNLYFMRAFELREMSMPLVLSQMHHLTKLQKLSLEGIGLGGDKGVSLFESLQGLQHLSIVN